MSHRNTDTFQEYNVFMRLQVSAKLLPAVPLYTDKFQDPAIQEFTGQKDSVEVIRVLRERKNAG